MIVAMCVALGILGALAKPLHIVPKYWNLTWYGPEGYGTERADVQSTLAGLPGGQLAIVRYGPGHIATDEEWVYDWADIDNSKVVWARELDAEHNKELMRYYAGRTAWLVEPDVYPTRVSPYPAQGETQAGTRQVGSR
jgi:hypothetical protein